MAMGSYGIELNERIKHFTCPHCGEQSVSVWGSISKNNGIRAVYLANLMTGHEEASARLTVSIGGWGEEAGTRRKWAYIEARPLADRFELMVREPEESLYYGRSILGEPMTRADVLNSTLGDQIFDIADFIAFKDPAVRSYLCGKEIDRGGRFTAIH